jgi:hypothetical protein
MKPRAKQLMRGRDCFLKDLNEGDTFTIKNSATRYKLYQKSDPNYIVTDESNLAIFASPNSPVKPLKEF